MSRARCLQLAERAGVDPDELLEWWTERAAVREFEGSQSRGEAEQGALEDIEALLEIGPWVLARRGPRSAPPTGASIAGDRKRSGE